MNFSRHFWTRVLYYSHVVRSHGRPDFPNFSNGQNERISVNVGLNDIWTTGGYGTVVR